MKCFLIRIADQKAKFFVELLNQLGYIDYREMSQDDVKAMSAELAQASIRDLARRTQQSHDNDIEQLRQIMANIDKQRKSH